MNRAALRGFETMMRLSASTARMNLAAAEVILRRASMMAQGGLSGPEAARMVMEKPAAFALGVQRAAMRAAVWDRPEAIMKAALAPVSVRVHANARRLRK